MTSETIHRDSRLRLAASAPKPRPVRRSLGGGGYLSASAGRIACFFVAIICTVATIAYTQGRRAPSGVKQVVPYDGTLVFTRVAYNTGLGRFGFNSSAWNHDYPAADRNVAAILDYITHTRVRLDGTNILGLDDPEIFENPILYVWEPGFWTIRPSEADNLRKYLLKGGFMIFDDFEGEDQWANMVEQMRLALPELSWIKLDERHPIFHAFYDVKRLAVPHPMYSDIAPAYYGLFEDNDVNGRMLALANHNNDIAEYWEWSAEGLYDSGQTGDAYRLGVNFFVYALTH